MSGYFNSIFNTTASRVASLKQNLLQSENDGDTEDDTHICRVLRGYYNEKGRAYPAWLPPDPRAPPPVVVQPVYPPSNIGRGYGGLNQQGASGGGQLSSLWDSQPQQPAQQEPQSLRPGGRGAPAARASPMRANPFSRQQSAVEPQAQVQARPLPSQRAGSQQSVGSPYSRADSGGVVPVSAKDRLKGQFGQKRSGSPAVSDQGQGGYRNDSYSSSSGGRGYDSRSNSSNAAPYPADNYGRSGSDGGGGGGKPFVSATAPWASNDSEFGGYEPAYDTSNNDRRPGLPSGPGAGRRGPGLPTGPRGPRY